MLVFESFWSGGSGGGGGGGSSLVGEIAEDIYSGAHGDVMPSAGPTSGKISPAGRPTQSGDVDV